MIEIKELRVGNHITNEESKILKVSHIGTFIKPNYIGVKDLNEKYRIVFSEVSLPIPLDCELLVLFGFKYAGSLFDCDLYKKGMYVISVIKGEFKFSLKEDPKSKYVHLKDIYSVHQLQNLYFALTGKELTINK